jgi:hypothetical protein
LSILQNLTADERRTVLGQHIQAMSARTGMTHTRYIGWGIALENDERQTQAEAQGRLFEVRFPTNNIAEHLKLTEHTSLFVWNSVRNLQSGKFENFTA